jgi:hypothetical protein
MLDATSIFNRASRSLPLATARGRYALIFHIPTQHNIAKCETMIQQGEKLFMVHVFATLLDNTLGIVNGLHFPRLEHFSLQQTLLLLTSRQEQREPAQKEL